LLGGGGKEAQVPDTAKSAEIPLSDQEDPIKGGWLYA
jgi:hypothetical protein